MAGEDQAGKAESALSFILSIRLSDATLMDTKRGDILAKLGGKKTPEEQSI